MNAQRILSIIKNHTTKAINLLDKETTLSTAHLIIRGYNDQVTEIREWMKELGILAMENRGYTPYVELLELMDDTMTLSFSDLFYVDEAKDKLMALDFYLDLVQSLPEEE